MQRRYGRGIGCKLYQLASLAAQILESAGVLAILLGAPAAAGAVPLQRRSGAQASFYFLYRRFLGAAILLGLEFMVAADIIRTVSHTPSLQEVLVLGLIVLIRTFLSFTLEVEIEGHWPWQKRVRA